VQTFFAFVKPKFFGVPFYLPLEVKGDGRAKVRVDSVSLIELGTLPELGTPPELSHSIAYDINDFGHVVGLASVETTRIPPMAHPLDISPSPLARSFYWTPEQGVRDIRGPQDESLLITSAYAINNHDQIVGSSHHPWGDRNERAFIWSLSSGVSELHAGNLNVIESVAYDVNDAGQVVGFMEYLLGDTEVGRAFLWTPDGGYVDLGTLGGEWAVAYGINNAGQVVGQSEDASGRHRGFLWTAAQGMVDIGNLEGMGNSVIARAINNAGQIVGTSYLANPFPAQLGRAFLWTPEQGMTDLGTSFDGAPFGSLTTGTLALGINDTGHVVGISSVSSGARRGFVWTPEQGMLEVGTLGGDMSEAHGISSSGWIVGRSANTANLPRAFIREP
jgi:probable HAF family extracellular repeat protein